MKRDMVRRLLHCFIMAAAVLTWLTMGGCSPDGNAGSDAVLREGTLLFQQGKYDGAVEKYLEVLKEDPENHVAYNLLGMAYRFQFNQLGAQKYKDREIEAFRKAIELEPDYWVAYKNIAASLYYQGRKKEAVPYLEKALQLQPNDPEKELLLQWIEEGSSP